MFWNNKLSNERIYIEADQFEGKEVETYKKINLHKIYIQKFKQTFARLNDYLDRMEELSTWKLQQICISCSVKFDYLPYENIIYGFLETSPFCNDCYYKDLDKLI